MVAFPQQPAAAVDPSILALAPPDPLDMVLRCAVATAIGVLLAIVYRRTHKGLSYSQSFTQTIVFVALIVALVMMAVKGSLATAFALVGALSIIRFRTVVKDTRDTAFVFAALALGMSSGLGEWWLTGIGGGVVVLVAVAMYATDFGGLYKSELVLRFTFDQARDSAGYLGRIADHAQRSSLLHVEPSGDGRSLRLSYDVALRKGATAEQLTGAMAKTDGVSDVVLIVAKNDTEF